VDRADRARRHAEVAAEAGIEVERLAVVVERGVNQDRVEKDVVTETRMNDVPVDSHVPHAGLDGHRLVGDVPEAPPGAGVHVHGKTHRGGDTAHSPVGEAPEDRGRAVAKTVAFVLPCLVRRRP